MNVVPSELFLQMVVLLLTAMRRPISSLTSSTRVFTDSSGSSLDHVTFDPPRMPRISKLVITHESVYEKLSTIPDRCSRTPDDIPPLFYRRLAVELSEPLSHIYSRSYEDGLLPRLFKTTLVTPVHKKGDRYLVKNYRPVAQAAIAYIAFERLLFEHINRHLDVNQLRDVNRHGFCSGRSTATQLTEMIHDRALLLNERVDFA